MKSKSIVHINTARFKNLLIFTILFTTLNSCQNSSNTVEEYPRMIGDISYDETIDNPNFKLCYNDSLAVQYYALTKVLGGKPYENEKYQVQKIFDEQYHHEKVKKESGLLRIRFIVNCQGISGRFRVIGMDEMYKEKEFDSSIVNQLLRITQNQIKWKSLKAVNVERDYYMYLTFKIEFGEIIEILP